MSAPRRKTARKEPHSPDAKASEPLQLPFASAQAWSAWLSKNHASSRGIWLRLTKKGQATPSVTYAAAVEVALAWGWIDGPKAKLDDAWWLQKFTPRGVRSLWSKINRDKALALIEAGTMMAPGLAEVERAKSDGRWAAAYDPQSRSTIPDDLAAAFAANPAAARFFETLEARNRYAVLFPIQTARSAELRAARIAKFVAMLVRQEKVHP